MIKYAVENFDEIKWFSAPPGDWDKQKRFIPETIQKLRDAGKLEDFLLDHGIRSNEGTDVIVDMEEVYETLRHESDEVLKIYIEGE